LEDGKFYQFYAALGILPGRRSGLILKNSGASLIAPAPGMRDLSSMEKQITSEERKKNPDANPDPITGAPGAHPVGTGLGAAAGGAAAGAAIGSVAGPVGTVAGIAAGAVVGGLAGKGIAEKIDPTVESAYWRENYRTREYVRPETGYETYEPAYRTGYEGYARHAGKRYEEVEPELQREYEARCGEGGLCWEDASPATRDAWDRVDRNLAEEAERERRSS
jgi:hypothetical protein